ncbi:Oligopeptide ABC transporter, periplasmic oligopeptide-binding protein OppA (TC 3.A.1.5.1) [hydrothermal vent metagenome]|uniref:Oligopeptide ABC transporter, periplasmic oligopeptide-binding protein OppA (TC 3.A.1.5.1) n=1 Tax=hydrothermal vent metagenome TaxID=652676 RepID=A0A3B0SPI8_9ZZZZ
MRANLSFLYFLAFSLMLLGGCSFAGDEDRARVTVVEDSKTRINPVGIRLNFASATMRSAIAKGLVGLDEEGRVVPALAARWIVTDDGLSYIFRLNEARWDDGRQVTSERIAKLLTERFRELGTSRLGSDLKIIDEVLSMTGRVIEIRLNAPQPNFLQLMAQPELGLFRAGHGAGPMRLVDETQDFILGIFEEPTTKNENSEEKEDTRQVTLRMDSAALAIARFNAGQADVVLGGKFHHLPLIEQAGIDSSQIKLDPVAGLFGLQFFNASGFWAAAENREILAMAIDRPALLTSFNLTAWQSRQKIIPEALDVEGINARPDWAPMTMAERREFARQHVSRWKSSGETVEPLRIGLPDAAGADILFLRIRADLRRVGLDARKVSLNEENDARLVDQIAPYDSAVWFLSRLTCTQTPVCINDADEKIAEGNAATNLEIKAKLYAEAEIILVNHYNYIPLGVPIRWSITRANQRGFAVNPRGWHPLNSLVGIPIS